MNSIPRLLNNSWTWNGAYYIVLKHIIMLPKVKNKVISYQNISVISAKKGNILGGFIAIIYSSLPIYHSYVYFNSRERWNIHKWPAYPPSQHHRIHTMCCRWVNKYAIIRFINHVNSLNWLLNLAIYPLFKLHCVYIFVF